MKSTDYRQRTDELVAKRELAQMVDGPAATNPGQQGITTGFGDLEAEVNSKSLGWIKVPAQKPIEIIMLCKAPTRYMVHWDAGGKPQYCIGSEFGCPFCMRRMHPDARYAFCVYDKDTNTRAFIELGSQPCRVIAETMTRATYLRGLVFRLSKEGGRYKGKMIVHPQNAVATPADLPEEIDPLPHILRQYGLEATK